MLNNKKQTVLLCGGPDHCGKTNILRELERQTGIPYFKASGEHKNFLSQQDKFICELRYADPRLVDFLQQTKHSVLIDRGYMCEFAYASFYKRKTDMTALRNIDVAYANLGAKILICTRNSFAGIADDLDPSLDEAALTKIAGYYDDFVAWTRCDTHVLYVDDHDLKRQTRDIMNFLQEK